MSLQVTTFTNGKWRQNCYIVVNDEGSALIIDPGSDANGISALLAQNGWHVQAILNTHAHYDHVGAVAPLKEKYGAPFYLHSADEDLLKHANLYRMLFESREAVKIPSINHDISGLAPEFAAGPFTISWISTPGHTPGSVCLRLKDLLFTGDTLMKDHVGRTDLPGGNRQELLTSVRKLMELPPETIVYGGHGPSTTLQAEFAEGSRVW